MAPSDAYGVRDLSENGTWPRQEKEYANLRRFLHLCWQCPSAACASLQALVRFEDLGGEAMELSKVDDTLRSWGASGKVTEYRHPMNNDRLYLKVDIQDLRDRLMHPQPIKPGRGIQNRGDHQNRES